MFWLKYILNNKVILNKKNIDTGSVLKRTPESYGSWESSYNNNLNKISLLVNKGGDDLSYKNFFKFDSTLTKIINEIEDTYLNKNFKIFNDQLLEYLLVVYHPIIKIDNILIDNTLCRVIIPLTKGNFFNMNIFHFKDNQLWVNYQSFKIYSGFDGIKTGCVYIITEEEESIMETIIANKSYRFYDFDSQDLLKVHNDNDKKILLSLTDTYGKGDLKNVKNEFIPNLISKLEDKDDKILNVKRDYYNLEKGILNYNWDDNKVMLFNDYKDRSNEFIITVIDKIVSNKN